MKRQRAINAVSHDTSKAGSWILLVRPPGGAPINLTRFRGVPVEIGNYSFSDPFGPGSLEFTVKGVSAFEELGVGDLTWAVKHADVDLIWNGDLPANYPSGYRTNAGVITPSFRWEGYITTFGVASSSGLSIQAKGAMLQLDNWLAKSEYTSRPLPYEWAISRQFTGKPALRLMPLRVVWPAWWTLSYQPVYKAPSWMIPAGVRMGQKWSGLLTRETGSMDPVLTNYIQSLIGAMYTERGRFTLMLDSHRQPVLYHQDFISSPSPKSLEVNPASPGVQFELTTDWDQCLTDVYAQGTSLAGVSYSGMQVSSDGTTTYYQPAASLRQTYPTNVSNGWFDRDVMPKEVMIEMQQGLEADDAAIVARAHLARFSDPGMTGTVTLSTDPTLGGEPISRFLVRAGMSLHLPGIGGKGIMAHITESSANLAEGEVSLTIDTKFRDALTVQEVRTRGRDALAISRSLVAGQYRPPIPDQMWPWSYGEGSGYVPSNSVLNAIPLFNGMPQFTPFPWTPWTMTHPPKDKRYRSCYIRIAPAQADATKNWALQRSPWGAAVGIPVRMSQAGTIRLLQVAAYDRDGRILRVPFHFSLWYLGSVNPLTMPAIPVEQAKLFPPYKANQRYPFVKDAFEGILRTGVRAGLNDPMSFESAGPVRIYGTYDEKAGYFPGSMASGDVPTGLLIDESQWSYDLTGHGDSTWDEYSIERNFTNSKAGNLYAMIYCDAQQDQEVFFVGRMFRVEPGQGG
ncbi:MAG TPA: hypothetical protein VIT65_22340 [Microlunatus sp.]